jgi:non-specific protein-tyrosine kinase
MTAVTDGSRPDASAGSLTRIAPAGALAEGALREWLLPGADRTFRGIYMRAGAGARTGEVLGVTSAIAGEGKTTVSVGLAVMIAQDFPQQRVLLVETNVEHPSLAEDFEIEPNPGLFDCLLNEDPMATALRPTWLDNLEIVPAGGPVVHPGRLLRSGHLSETIAAARETHDLIILDLPATLVNSDVLLLTELADSVIVTVRAGVTPISLVNKAVKLLDQEKLRGIVLNGARSSVPGWLRRLSGM